MNSLPLNPLKYKHSILVIDDEAAIRKFLTVGLEAEGYTVVEAETGKDGIREFIGADSLHFLSLEGLRECVAAPDEMCYACFNSAYPIKQNPELPVGADKYVFEQRKNK